MMLIQNSDAAVCKIADLIVSVPDAGVYNSRFQDYLVSGKPNSDIDIVIDPNFFLINKYPDGTDPDVIRYLESARLFSVGLLSKFGCSFHASAVALNNRAYLFSGPSGIGKSTHTGQWLKEFGDRARIINDDKPPIRRIDGVWYVFGSPWCGKDGIQINTKVPLAGICFLSQAEENKIKRLSSNEAMFLFLSQTIHKFIIKDNMNNMMNLLDKLIREIPIFELENYPGPECVKLSYETMTAAAEEMGL